MRISDSGETFSPQGTALIQMAVSAHAPGYPEPPSLEAYVRYASGSLSEDEATALEHTLHIHPTHVEKLAEVFRVTEDLRNTPLYASAPAEQDSLRQQVQVIWTRLMESSEPRATDNSTLLALASLTLSGREAMRSVRKFLMDLLDPTLAPQRVVFAGSLRSSMLGPLLENIEGEVALDANITEDGSLQLSASIPIEAVLSPNSICVGFELNRQWVRLAIARCEDGRCSLSVPGFGELVGLSPGPLPPDLFALRPLVWPSVCGTGSFVVQAGTMPFVEVEAEPSIEAGMMKMNLRLLPESTELRQAKELEVWYGTGGQVWQLVGRWPIPPISAGTMAISFEAPTANQSGQAFSGILKLALKT